MPRVTSDEIAQHLGLSDDAHLSLQRLRAMFDLDHWGLGGFTQVDDGWSVMLTRDIWRFLNVQTVEDCIEAREAWLAEGRLAVPYVNADPELFQNGLPVAPVGSRYVNEQISDAIRAKADLSKFDVTKLLSLINELNDNYARKNTYAARTLLRAILDHIPPILGCANFQEVANNYKWERTDKNYIKRLDAFKDQGDDALHRQISTKPDLLDFDDMPAGVYVDRLFQECADRL